MFLSFLDGSITELVYSCSIALEKSISIFCPVLADVSKCRLPQEFAIAMASCLLTCLDVVSYKSTLFPTKIIGGTEV